MDAFAPSRTAEYMALFRALESARPAEVRLFEDRCASRFLTARLRSVVRAASFQPLGRLLCSYIDSRWPGPRLSGIVRTRAIDDFVVSSMTTGCTQLLLLGAGYDTRAVRLSEVASTAVFEVDHPATQARKRQALGSTPPNVRYVPVNFERNSLQQELERAGFERDRQSCVLWEGVFSYLTVEAIDAMLLALLELCATGSRILITYVDEGALKTAQPDGVAWMDAVSDVGEPFLTGLDPACAEQFFADRGLTLRQDESTADAARRLSLSGAHSIPPLYRLATLELTDRSVARIGG
jgi:methyltransferase (TIGR00027 family)